MKVVWIVTAISFLCLIVSWVLLPGFISDSNGHTALGTLFTGLAFAGFIFTALMQTKAYMSSEAHSSFERIQTAEASFFGSLSHFIQLSSNGSDRLQREIEALERVSTSELADAISEVKSTLEQVKVSNSNEEIRNSLIEILDSLSAVIINSKDNSELRLAAQETKNSYDKITVTALNMFPKHAHAAAIRYNKQLSLQTGGEFKNPKELLALISEFNSIK